jgi:hypothetical protein
VIFRVLEFTLNQIKFDIDISDDELLKTIGNWMKKPFEEGCNRRSHRHPLHHRASRSSGPRSKVVVGSGFHDPIARRWMRRQPLDSVPWKKASWVLLQDL